ncbi:hypothetical protein AAH978_19885 [Streptomyces sp. ZYX-F-203]
MVGTETVMANQDPRELDENDPGGHTDPPIPTLVMAAMAHAAGAGVTTIGAAMAATVGLAHAVTVT